MHIRVLDGLQNIHLCDGITTFFLWCCSNRYNNKKSESSIRCCSVKISYEPLLYTILEKNEELMNCEEGNSFSAYNLLILK